MGVGTTHSGADGTVAGSTLAHWKHLRWTLSAHKTVHSTSGRQKRMNLAFAFVLVVVVVGGK